MLFFSLMIFCSSSLNPQSWIGDSLAVIGSKTLKEVTLPGTHDSGTYYLTDIAQQGDSPEFWDAIYTVADKLNKNTGAVAIDWSKTQNLNFYQQMQGGIRYFDLRAGWNQSTSTWVTFHFIQGSPVIELLQNISQFLKDEPKEIVIVEISHFRGSPSQNDIQTLKNMVLQTLGSYLYPVDLDFSFTIGEMVSKGLRAVVTMDEGFNNNNIWPPQAIYNTYANTPDLVKMVQFNNQTIQQFMKNGCNLCLFKISWTLTANNLNIIESIEPWKPHTLIQLADYGNKALPSFWNNIQKFQWVMGNILIIDHFENSDIMNVIWKSNNLA